MKTKLIGIILLNLFFIQNANSSVSDAWIKIRNDWSEIKTAWNFYFGNSTPTALCPKLTSSWNEHYIKDFKVKWDTSTFDCPSKESNVALAFYDLEVSQFTPNKSGYIPNFYNYVRNLIKGLQHDSQCSTIANAQPKTGKIRLCPTFYSYSRESRASTLVHEARHLESDDPRHENCVGGKYDGHEGACDDFFYNGKGQGGGYNYDVFFFSWMMSDIELNELSESVLRSELNFIIPDRFNKISEEEIQKWRAK